MRIMIIGAGGVGGFLAAHLARRPEVALTLVARGGQLAAIRENGLTLRDPEETFAVRPACVTEDPAQAGTQDAVLLCTKGYGLLQAAEQARPAIGRDTLVIPLQNGVDAAERIAPLLPPCLPAQGCIYVFSRIVSPGVVERTGALNRVLLGGGPPEAAPRLAALAEAMCAAGVPTEVSGDIERELWVKWAFICGGAQAASYFGYTAGQLCEDPEAMAFFCGLIDELYAVGRARGVDLPRDLKEQMQQNIRSQPYEARSSLSRDLEAPGKPTELDQFAGTLCRMADAAGIPVPCNRRMLERFGDRL